MASTRRKSAAIALAVVGIAGLSLAAAAQLEIRSDTLGAGTDTVASCDTDGIDVDYTVVGDEVTGILLDDVATACNGDQIRIQLQTGASGTTALGSAVSQTLTLVAGSDSVVDTASISLGASNYQLVEAVTGIAIVIN